VLAGCRANADVVEFVRGGLPLYVRAQGSRLTFLQTPRLFRHRGNAAVCAPARPLARDRSAQRTRVRSRSLSHSPARNRARRGCDQPGWRPIGCLL